MTQLDDNYGIALRVASGVLLVGAVLVATATCLQPDFGARCGSDGPGCFKHEVCIQGTCYPEEKVRNGTLDVDLPEDTGDTTEAGDTGETEGPENPDADDTTTEDTAGDTVRDTSDAGDVDGSSGCKFARLDEGVCRGYDPTAGDGEGTPGECVPPPGYTADENADRPDRLDGYDNDCDGTVDEPLDCTDLGQIRKCYGGPYGKAGNGPCEWREQSCGQNKKFSECPELDKDDLPQPEKCDPRSARAIDNDCDGLTDEGLDCR